MNKENSMGQEIWKAIPGFEGLYEASTLGRIRRLPAVLHTSDGRTPLWKGRILKQTPFNKNYLVVSLCKDGVPYRVQVHRLIAKTFISNSDGKPVVDHINGDPSDNRVENLRWATDKENMHNPITFERYLKTRKRGAENCNYGKHRSESTRAKISASHKGKKYSKERVEKMRETAIKYTPRGANHYKAKPIDQFTREGDFVQRWPCAADAARFYGFTNGALSLHLHGRTKHCNNFIWKYSTT